MTEAQEIMQYIQDGQYGRILKRTLPFGMSGSSTNCIWVLPKDVVVKKTNPSRDDKAVLVWQDGEWIREGKWQETVDVLINSGKAAEQSEYDQDNTSDSAAVKEAETVLLLENYTNDV